MKESWFEWGIGSSWNPQITSPRFGLTGCRICSGLFKSLSQKLLKYSIFCAAAQLRATTRGLCLWEAARTRLMIQQSSSLNADKMWGLISTWTSSLYWNLANAAANLVAGNSTPVFSRTILSQPAGASGGWNEWGLSMAPSKKGILLVPCFLPC